MTHPIVVLQAALVGALQADAGLAGVGVFDAPGRGAVAPYLVVARHDLLPRDGDDAPGFEHRVMVHCWAADPSRRAALALAGRVLAVADALTASGLRVTHRAHERTETAIDGETGQARAAVALRFFTEAS
ncbi:MAG: DUF3168 domain-containing protein [Devosia sp.]